MTVVGEKCVNKISDAGSIPASSMKKKTGKPCQTATGFAMQKRMDERGKSPLFVLLQFLDTVESAFYDEKEKRQDQENSMHVRGEPSACQHSFRL